MTSAVKEVQQADGVVDSRAPRLNQFFVIMTVVAAFLLDAPWVLYVLYAVLLLGVWRGHDWILPYRIYHKVIQPKAGVGRVEDSRAPRFAQAFGGTGLAVGATLVYLGLHTAGWAVALTIAALASVSVVADFCLGCFTYRMLAKLRGVSRKQTDRVDPADLGGTGEPMLVEFFHPLCHECQQWKAKLESGDRPFRAIDVSQRPDLAERYGISFVPTVLELDASGTVVRQLAP